MSPTEVGVAGLILIMIVILLGVHLAFALILICFVGLTMIIGLGPALSSLALIAFNKVNSYDFAVVPLFLLMSAFVSRSGIGKEAYETAYAWVGQLKGGLSMATTVACGLFAACCGSIGTMYRGVMPFLAADISHVALLIAVPSLATFLPEMMLGG